jgi:hypothetical protein
MWLPIGDRPIPQSHTIEATRVLIDSPTGFTTLTGTDDSSVFTINNAFLVSIERITEKG